MEFKYLSVKRQKHIAIVSLNRPEVANALSLEKLREISICAKSFEEDAETRVVIFTGTGKHFSSGADLDDLPKQREASLVLKRRRFRAGERAMQAILEMDQITIGAWNGGAIGGGACLATAMDFRIGAAGCFIQYPEIDLGLNLMWQSLPLTIRLVGPTKAKRLVIGGERVNDETLLSWGLLEDLVPLKELLPRTLSFAETYVNKSPVAAQMIKRSVNQITGALDRAIMHMDADQNIFAMTTDDQTAAAEAYLAGVLPNFKGD